MDFSNLSNLQCFWLFLYFRLKISHLSCGASTDKSADGECGMNPYHPLIFIIQRVHRLTGYYIQPTNVFAHENPRPSSSTQTYTPTYTHIRTRDGGLFWHPAYTPAHTHSSCSHHVQLNKAKMCLHMSHSPSSLLLITKAPLPKITRSSGSQTTEMMRFWRRPPWCIRGACGSFTSLSRRLFDSRFIEQYELSNKFFSVPTNDISPQE